MDPEIIILSDDDDDETQMPPPPPRAPKPGLKSDRPCPKSKKKNYDLSDGDGACARPATSAAKQFTSAARPFTSVARPVTSVARPSTAAARPATATMRPSATTVRPTATAMRPAAIAVRPSATAVRPATTAVRPAATAVRPAVAVTAVAAMKYPPPYPKVPRHATQQASWKNVPPAPTLKLIGAGADGSVEIAWEMKSSFATQRWAEVKAYELYVCRETDAPPDSSMWRMVDVITDQPLPEGCVLVNCPPGVHHIALRAIDVHDRRAPFNKMVVTI